MAVWSHERAVVAYPVAQSYLVAMGAGYVLTLALLAAVAMKA